MYKGFLFVSLALYFSPGFAQKIKLTQTQLADLEREPVAENVIGKISVSELNKAQEKVQLSAAYFLKALMHRNEPRTYPADAESDPEKKMIRVVSQIPADVFARLHAKAQQVLNEPEKRRKYLGKLSELDLRKPSITADIKKQTNARLDNYNRNTVTQNLFESLSFIPHELSQSSRINDFSKIDLLIRAVHCLDETYPEGSADEMVVGGVLVGASLNGNKAEAFDAGDFDDGTYLNYGTRRFGTYNLNATNNYPKVLYCLFVLIESDTNENELVADLKAVTDLVGDMITEFNWISAEDMGVLTDDFVAMLVSEDRFPAYCISLNLSGNNHFGSDGKSSNMRTGRITGKGGVYKIGIRWQMMD